jgi:hypothetical protein
MVKLWCEQVSAQSGLQPAVVKPGIFEMIPFIGKFKKAELLRSEGTCSWSQNSDTATWASSSTVLRTRPTPCLSILLGKTEWLRLGLSNTNAVGTGNTLATELWDGWASGNAEDSQCEGRKWVGSPRVTRIKWDKCSLPSEDTGLPLPWGDRSQ